MRKIIIDGDPGHDDIVAIMIALANNDKLDLLGVCTVGGNCTVDNATNNVLMVFDHLGIKDIPVCQGYSEPMVRPLVTAEHAHGKTGLDGPVFKPATSQKSPLHAIEFMKKCALENDKITIVTIGPMTNLAMFIRTYPHLLNRVEEVVSMAGSVYSGNQAAKGEFNVWEDPEAADIVLKSGLKVTLAPTEVCYAGGILLAETDRYKDCTYKAGKLYYDIMKFYNRYAIKNGWDRTAIFDMTTVIYLLKPEIFKKEDMMVYIETAGSYTRGMTVCDFRGDYYFDTSKKNATVLLDVEREQFAQVLFDALETLNTRLG